MQEQLSTKTIGDILDYIKGHPKRTKVFHSWDDSTILSYLLYSAETQGLMWYEDNEQKIQGIAVMERNDKDKLLKIVGVLSSNCASMPAFAKKYLSMFYGYTISTRRKGKYFQYKNPIILCQKISRLA